MYKGRAPAAKPGNMERNRIRQGLVLGCTYPSTGMPTCSGRRALIADLSMPVDLICRLSAAPGTRRDRVRRCTDRHAARLSLWPVCGTCDREGGKYAP